MFWTAFVNGVKITVEENTKEEAEIEVFSLCGVLGVEGEIVVTEDKEFVKEY